MTGAARCSLTRVGLCRPHGRQNYVLTFLFKLGLQGIMGVQGSSRMNKFWNNMQAIHDW